MKIQVLKDDADNLILVDATDVRFYGEDGYIGNDGINQPAIK